MEKEELEIVEERDEDEMMSNEAFDLIADLNSTVAYGESLGVFTPKEAADWYAGIDACVKVSHLRGLMPYLDRFIASGEARLRQLEKAANSTLLTASEQRGYLNQADSLTYGAKGLLISEIKSLIKELDVLRNRLLAVLSQKKMAATDQSSFISKFYSASANSKSSVVSEAENVSITESSAQIITEEPVDPDPPTAKTETAESTIVPKDPKADYIGLIEHYSKHDQFSQAADLLEASSRYFNLIEYRALLKRIEKAKLAKEIPDLQAFLRAA
ncbi:hypothetical protein A2810_00295 [candidate division Kazan bacterium RIFCSPHIGHO2_01_FULL_49_10]|nr:MAG: hypothetical protein A2810_00295 [candidate division Kazan bacterium RIFCSPHIGHO2_01_FULL_49_10]